MLVKNLFFVNQGFNIFPCVGLPTPSRELRVESSDKLKFMVSLNLSIKNSPLVFDRSIKYLRDIRDLFAI